MEYTAVIADIVHSRRLQANERATLQLTVEEVLENLNSQYQQSISSRFLITVGDELQGLLCKPSAIPDIIWDIETSLNNVQIRIGIGQGCLTTELRSYALGMDGPVWHRAREAIEQAKYRHRLGGVFLGFGEPHDLILGGFARILHHHRSNLTSTRKAVLDLLRSGMSQADISRFLRVTNPTISKHVKEGGMHAYLEAEYAWRRYLESFDAV